MSDAQHTEHEANHEGPIRTPKQLIGAVVASFVVPIVVIIMLANFVDFGGKSGAGSDGMSEQAIAKRIQPVGSIVLKDASAPVVLKTGEQVYTAQCAACHATGAAGAPKLGDAAAWAPRIKTGYDALLTSALKGKGAMGATGRWRDERPGDRPRRGLHRQPGRRQVRRAGRASCRRFGSVRPRAPLHRSERVSRG
jgi:cytochrome c5